MRSRTAITLPPGARRSSAASPSAPLDHPTCGGHFNECNKGFELALTKINRNGPGCVPRNREAPLPAVFVVSPCVPRMEEAGSRGLPGSAPAVTRSARQAETGHQRAGPGATPASGPPAAPPLELMHPHLARHRWSPADSRPGCRSAVASAAISAPSCPAAARRVIQLPRLLRPAAPLPGSRSAPGW